MAWHFLIVIKKTALITDWSHQGIGYILLQKHCAWGGYINVHCCKSGWKMVSCVFIFLQPSENFHVAIEGEMLAITWALKKCKMFLLGCPKFYIFKDHHPLVKILGEKSLGEIDNPKLLKYKEKTLCYSFDTKYIRGLDNYADFLSRHSVDKPDDNDIE